VSVLESAAGQELNNESIEQEELQQKPDMIKICEKLDLTNFVDLLESRKELLTDMMMKP
jgi:hypothetical protein